HLARIGKNSPDVEQVRAGMRRVQLGRLVVVGHGIINLVGLRVHLGEVVIVSGQFHISVGLFLFRFGGSAQVDCFLVIDSGGLVALLFFFRSGLFGRRVKVGVAECRPDLIVAVVDLVGFIQGGDCCVVVLRIGSRTGSFEFIVKRANGFRCGQRFGFGLLLSLELFRSQSLTRGLGCLFFL